MFISPEQIALTESRAPLIAKYKHKNGSTAHVWKNTIVGSDYTLHYKSPVGYTKCGV